MTLRRPTADTPRPTSVAPTRTGQTWRLRHSGLSLLGAAAAAAFLHASPARAQQLEQYLPPNVTSFGDPTSVPVAVRPRTLYDPLGVHLGNFTIMPRLDQSVGFDDNPSGAQSKRGSAVLETAPAIAIASGFSADTLDMSFGLDNKRYFEQPQESRTDYTLAGNTAINIGRTVFKLQGSYLALHEDPTQIDSASLATPLGFTAGQVTASDTISLGRWQIEPNVGYLSYRFDNVVEPGDTISQIARNRDLFAVGTTARYGFQQSRSAIVTMRAVDTNYVSSLGGLARPDSFAYELLAGTDYAFSGSLRLLLLVGYEVRQFSHSAYGNIASPVAEASVIWTPTGLTTVTATASRSVEDSVGESTGGVTYTRGRLKVDHEYRRNILLQAWAGLEVIDYNTGGTERDYLASASASYLFNRNMRAKLSWDFQNRNGPANTLTDSLTGITASGSAGDFTRNVFLLTISLAI